MYNVLKHYGIAGNVIQQKEIINGDGDYFQLQANTHLALSSSGSQTFSHWGPLTTN